jgi:hypothetical protein
VPTVTHPATECEAPPALIVHDAHAAMQEHVRCSTAACAARQAAIAVLGAAGHIVLASAATVRRQPVAP